MDVCVNSPWQPGLYFLLIFCTVVFVRFKTLPYPLRFQIRCDAKPMNRQTTFEFPVDSAPFPAPVVRAARPRGVVASVAGVAPPFQLALEASGDPLDVRLPVLVPERVHGDDVFPAGRQREPRGRDAKPQKVVSVHARGRSWEVSLRIVPDEYEPHAVLMACDELGERIAEERVVPDFRLTESVARSWIEGDFQ